MFKIVGNNFSIFIGTPTSRAHVTSWLHFSSTGNRDKSTVASELKPVYVPFQHIKVLRCYKLYIMLYNYIYTYIHKYSSKQHVPLGQVKQPKHSWNVLGCLSFWASPPKKGEIGRVLHDGATKISLTWFMFNHPTVDTSTPP
jgi:hypothetical protein